MWNGCWICVVLAAVMTILTNMLTNPLLQLINTPADILDNAARYIRVLFWGIPVTILYNFTAGILRASGDSQRPTNHLLISSCIWTISALFRWAWVSLVRLWQLFPVSFSARC